MLTKNRHKHIVLLGCREVEFLRSKSLFPKFETLMICVIQTRKSLKSQPNARESRIARMLARIIYLHMGTFNKLECIAHQQTRSRQILPRWFEDPCKRCCRYTKTQRYTHKLGKPFADQHAEQAITDLVYQPQLRQYNVPLSSCFQMERVDMTINPMIIASGRIMKVSRGGPCLPVFSGYNFPTTPFRF